MMAAKLRNSFIKKIVKRCQNDKKDLTLSTTAAFVIVFKKERSAEKTYNAIS